MAKQNFRSMMRAKRIARFSEFAFLDPKKFDHPDFNNESTAVPFEEDETLKMIFAPDPITHIPRSDLAIVVNNETRPEIAQFINNTLMRPMPESLKHEDPDVALDMVKSRCETLRQYADRLREISVNEQKSLRKQLNINEK